MEKITYEDGTTEITKEYTNLFYSNLALRPCCGSCRFASTERVADFTVADYWGVEKHFPEFFDNDGISLLFLNTPRAKEVFESIKDDCYIVETTIDKCIQHNMRKPTPIPAKRQNFWTCLKKHGFEKASRRYTVNGAIFRFKNKTVNTVKRVAYKLLKNFIGKR